MANLISIQTYKQAKAITSSKDEEKLSTIIPSISQLVKTYCGNSFLDYVTEDKVEFHFPHRGENEIILDETPIINVSEVWERAAYTDEYELVDPAEYRVNPRVDSIVRLGGPWMYDVKIVYNAGYEELPLDLRLAVIDLITYYHKEEYKQLRTTGSASIQNVVTSTLKGNTDFPDHIKRVLDMYRDL